ncbi:S41 family peptidase [Gloeobacter morelensis]|uniref:S41 family peptidase n=1 Tax=Gloeobacter morelensis MG652769 TaxID=2781736 RepID=A0ABY3PR48_9CYAN|nr:S41 family peptidase [Gloeobacter morelensis]UFP96018.1 S41 family peptidase [Gloeobacter morelensis MG652769]
MQGFFRKSVLLTVILSLVGSAAVTAAPKQPVKLRAEYEARLEDSPKAIVDEVWQTVDREFVDPTFNKQNWIAARGQLLGRDYKSKEEAYEAIRNSLKVLGDPYTRFLDPREFQALRDQTSGELVGVGIQLGVSQASKLPVVVKTLEDSPASRSGIQAKDELLAVDGKPTAKLEIGEVSRMIRGDRGTQVTLSVLRSGQKMSFTITRAPIELKVVTSSLKEENDRKVGYIRLAEFSEKAPSEMQRAFAKLSEAGAQGWVLDLRGNPGGLLDAATRVASLVLDQGTIVSTVDRAGTQDQLTADRHPVTNLPLVVLVDQGSASASEILAGAIQDNRRGTLVGMKTFGKGVIQQVNALSDGSGVNVTIAHYLTPSGNDIHKKGIQPDVVVAFPEEARKAPIEPATGADIQYQRAVTVLAKLIETKPATSARQ